MENWRVVVEHFFSEHSYIEFTIREKRSVEWVSRIPRCTNWYT